MDDNLLSYPPVHLPDVPHRRLLEGQVAVITGANSGIGRAAAISIGAAGANVCVNFVGNPEAAAEVVAEIESHGSHAMVHKADISKEEQVIAMFDEARAAFREAPEIGRAAVWLASDDSDYIHAASIFIDGGMTLYPGFEAGG